MTHLKCWTHHCIPNEKHPPDNMTSNPKLLGAKCKITLKFTNEDTCGDNKNKTPKTHTKIPLRSPMRTSIDYRMRPSISDIPLKAFMLTDIPSLIHSSRKFFKEYLQKYVGISFCHLIEIAEHSYVFISLHTPKHILHFSSTICIFLEACRISLKSRLGRTLMYIK